MNDNVGFVLKYLEAMDASPIGPELAAYFTEDLVQEEFPNRFMPNGATRNLQDVLDAAERGRTVTREQHFDVVNAFASGDDVSVECIWTGKMSIQVGSIPPGGEMRARFAMFFTLRDGKISGIRNYDCFDPF